MIRKAVVLAGGRGTRLATVVADRPKPMAEIRNLPFLHYLILDLKNKGITEVVLLVGYMHELIEDYFQKEYHGVKISYEIEHEPRGTGGLVCELSRKWSESILLINGDTYFDVDIQSMHRLYLSTKSVVMAVREVDKQDRYGALEIENDIIIDFKEKTWIEKGYINGGIYLLPQGVFETYSDLPFSFSLEKEFFEAYKSDLNIKPFYSDGFFIDIGIPEDFQAAQTSIPRQLFPKLDKTWTIFLDRDGVLNKHLPDDYVKHASEFEWIEGSKEAVKLLSDKVGKVLVVTNQQGIGKKLMSELDIQDIHYRMQNDVEDIGGKIDRAYYCPHLKFINCKCRKPKSGMAYQAKDEFPDIDFSKSILIGDSITDIQFGQNLGMFTIYLSARNPSKIESLKLEKLGEVIRLFNH
jgi:D-glycero-alpha-D-manno-heptose 1-phosphate guanylyltransferase